MRSLNTRRSGSLQLAITHVLGLPITGRSSGVSISCYKGGVLPENLVEIEPCGGSAFFLFDFSVVQLDEILQFAHNIRSVVGVIGARVVREPEHAEVLESR